MPLANHRKLGWTWLIAPAALLTLVLFAACGGGSSSGPARPVSQVEARSILGEMTRYATANDLNGLCGKTVSPEACQARWSAAGEWASIPSQEPEVVETFVPPAARLASLDATQDARVLVIKGIDGQGREYRTEFLVFRAKTGETLIENPVYWAAVN